MRLATIAALVLGLLAAALPAAHAADVPPYQAAMTLTRATMGDVQSRGILGVKPHVDEIEQALAGGRKVIDDNAANGMMLVDGLGETLAAMAIASKR